MSKDLKLINVLSLAKVDPFVYDNYLTYLELSIALGKKLNEIISVTNSMSEIVNGIDTNFTDIYNKIDLINESITKLYSDLDIFENRINTNVETRLQNMYRQMVSLMNDYQIIFNNSLNQLRLDLEKQINEVILGNIIAYDPTTGEESNINVVIMNLYDALRQNSITVNEFEALDLTALAFDNKDISAFNFDINGKLYLNS